MTKPVRIPVILDEEDNKLMLQLIAKLQTKLNKRQTVAGIVRIALRTLAKAEGIATASD